MLQRYYIKCEQMVYLDIPGGHSVMIYPETRWDVAEYEFCSGPFASCPPPELEEEWQNHIEEPSSTDVFLMNNQAQELLQDFIAIN